jgi:hypothetical protein
MTCKPDGRYRLSSSFYQATGPAVPASSTYKIPTFPTFASHQLTPMRTGQAQRGSRTARLTKYTKPLSTYLPPLTRPSSEQKSSTQESRTVLEDVIREIENRKIGRGFSDTPWLCFDLPRAAYELWEQQYQNGGFVQDKLRYAL